MMTEGLLEEAKRCFSNHMHKQLKVLAIKNFSRIFSGEQSLEMAVETVKQQSRRYAKRQLTWFRNRMVRALVGFGSAANRFAQVGK